jgi:hypothetical protein
MIKMGETVKTDMIATPDWMLHSDESNLFDSEMQMYQALSMEQKFAGAVKANDATRLYEIVFHFLNINALKSDSKLYDEHFKEIRGNDALAAFAKDLSSNNDGTAARIVGQINEVYTRILAAYIAFAIREIAGAKIKYFDPRNVHYMNVEAYALFSIKPHEYHELWQMEFKTENKLGNEIQRMQDFKMKVGDTKEFKDYVRAFNRKNPISRIRSGNFIMIECDDAKDSKNIVSIVKDIILLNKIFYERNEFNPSVLVEIQQVIADKKTFPFKLLLR